MKTIDAFFFGCLFWINLKVAMMMLLNTTKKDIDLIDEE